MQEQPKRNRQHTHMLLLFSLLAFAIPVANQEPQANGIFAVPRHMEVKRVGMLDAAATGETRCDVRGALGSDRIKVSCDQVYGDLHSRGDHHVRFDGQTHPADGFPIFGPPQTPPVSGSPKTSRFVAVRWVNDHTLIWTLHTYDLDNGTHGTLTLTTTVSDDGRTMTGIGSDGTVRVFERQ